MIIDILTNTVSTIFWAVYYVYRNLELLQQLREELGSVVAQGRDKQTSNCFGHSGPVTSGINAECWVRSLTRRSGIARAASRAVS